MGTKSCYPTNLLVGDFRISIRASGRNPGERRISREKIWKEKANFDILKRKTGEDPEATLAEVGYLGENVPLEFDLYLRMRQKQIKKVIVEDKQVEFETYEDDCSTFLAIPVTINTPGLLKLKITHEPFKRQV